jgi:CRISPR-associated protein Cas5t
MISVQVQAPYATFRKSYARSFAETYPLAPPATVYGMLLSLVGERFRERHEGVGLAFGYASVPKIATTLRKLSRFKYGVASKQSTLGNAPDYIESLCDLDFVCWIDSSTEREQTLPLLEQRIEVALTNPSSINRYGVLSLGLSDDAVDVIRKVSVLEGRLHRLIPAPDGQMELPIWVDHVGSAQTRWQRFNLDSETAVIESGPPQGWPMTAIARSVNS